MSMSHLPTYQDARDGILWEQTPGRSLGAIATAAPLDYWIGPTYK